MKSGIKIKGWEKFQHYKNRKPPWIKLYRDLIDDMEFYALSGDAAKTLVLLWVIASEADGYLPDIKVLAFRLRIDDKKCKKLLSELNHYIDSGMLANCMQDATPERERETETEKSKSKSKDKSAFAPFVFLSSEEFSKLVDKFGTDEQAKRAIEILNNYKASSGKKYKSDYHACIGWVFEKIGSAKQNPVMQTILDKIPEGDDISNGYTPEYTDEQKEELPF